VNKPEARAGARLAVIGGGRMGGALVKAWATHYPGLKSNEILVIDPDRAARDNAENVGARTAGHAEKEQLADLDTVVIAVKPQLLDGVAPALAPILPPGVLLISIVAGATIAKLKQHFPRAFVLRAMPNRPTEIGQGATAFIAHSSVTEGQRERARALLEVGGVVVELKDEALMDVVTALSGSGPAYVFALVEAMAAAAAAEGLPADLAAALARATVAGAGAMLAAENADAAELRESVTSAGGTTEAALGVLRASDGLQSLMERAISAAAWRAKELGG
jgi:pyrroline-5-carboxylate reductase